MKPRLHTGHLIVAALLFAVEVCIALFADDPFVRPYVGDVMVIPLIYCAVAAFWAIRPARLGLAVLAFAFAVEIGQYCDLVERLGLEDNAIARTVIGHAYSTFDLVAYTVGAVFTVGVHLAVSRRRRS